MNDNYVLMAWDSANRYGISKLSFSKGFGALADTEKAYEEAKNTFKGSAIELYGRNKNDELVLWFRHTFK